ncbi:MAG: S8 family serine peptidase, partial [Muribaculaceae bacterium]|nr:S8 family serine peptidase [Muribaculaceae bacterium]
MNKLFSSHILKFALFLLLPVLPAFARGDSEESASPDDTHYAAIIKIASEDAISQLEENGVEILRRRDELLLCYVPYAAQKKLSPLNSSLKTKRKPDGISKIEKGRRVNISMDNAREWFGASVINEGNADFPPFTGKGVVTGICDVGIDPLHIAFLDEKGEPRIKRVVQYKEGSGERIVMDSKEEYTAWQTDTPDNWHATHVANIMAGSYGPYRGMASGSDIVITTSQLTDVGLLCGAEDILEYARENGKRAVINMSMANYIGPHDGSSLFSQYLDRVAEEAIVVLSAGNAGNTNFTLPIDFSEATPSAALALYSSDWVQFNPYGAVDVWSPDDTPLKVRFGIFNGQDKENLIWYPWQKLAEGKTFKITSDSGQATSSDTETVLYDDTFSSIYDGWFSRTG